MTTVTIDTIRSSLALVEGVLQEIDTLSARANAVRFQHELVRRYPEMGFVSTDQGPRSVDADEVKRVYDGAVSKRDIYTNTLCAAYGFAAIDELREAFERAEVAYQYYLKLQGLATRAEIGDQQAREELSKQDLLNADERTAHLERARALLIDAAAVFILPPVSSLVVARDV